MPYAFAQTGVFLSCSTMLLVAVCNDIITCIMIRAAAYTGLDSYEALAEWAGGKAAKV
jgi:amino acid permease